MSDLSKSDLWAFMQTNGTSLERFGSSDFGFNAEKAIEVILLLKSRGLKVLGIEKWKLNNDRYELQSLDGWYLDDDDGNSWDHAASFFNGRLSEDTDLFTVQF
jgi:hypothetical protein